jgi:hypothetical protein
VAGTTLHAQSRSSRGQTSVTLGFGGDLREFTALSDLATQRTSVTVGGWDVAGKSALAIEATDSAISSELGNDESGVSILKSALGDRKEGVTHGVPAGQQEAQARAEAYFRTLAPVRDRPRRRHAARQPARRRLGRPQRARHALQR